MELQDLARARVLPRWQAAFKQERYYYEACVGGPFVPFTVEQTAAIRSGATTLELGMWTATISGDTVTIDGNPHELKTGTFKPESLVISSEHSSSHLDIDAILKELYIVTGIDERRWLINVDESGTLEVYIAPSVAYIAEEIRARPMTDHVSLGQWLCKYDVKASPSQLKAVFGSTACFLADFVGTDDDIIKGFFAPVRVILHGKARRVINALGTFTIKQVLDLAPTGPWHLHGVPLLPFDNVAIWRCCTHCNAELHLYDQPWVGVHESRATVAGVLALPSKATSLKAFVPHFTVSGNMFGDPPLYRVLDVVAAAPAVLTSAWLTMVNANHLIISFDHAVLMLDALKERYGRTQCIQAIGAKMAPGQRVVFETAVAQCCDPRIMIRRRYRCYVQCIRDLLNETFRATPLQVTVSGRINGMISSARRTHSVSPIMKWSNISSRVPPGSRLVVTAPTSAAAQVAMARGDFILEELRSDRIELTLESVTKRARLVHFDSARGQGRKRQR